jgi:hypothetical protein
MNSLTAQFSSTSDSSYFAVFTGADAMVYLAMMHLTRLSQNASVRLTPRPILMERLKLRLAA